MIRKLSFATIALSAMLACGSLHAQTSTNGNCNTCPPSSGYVSGHAHGAHLHGAVAHVGQSVHAVGGAIQGHMLNYGQLAASGANANGFGSNAGWVWHSSWGDYWARTQANQRPWHGGYYWMRTGQPTALVVPPTVTMQSNYSWGVSQNTMTPVYHQFGGNPPNGAGGGVFRATPYWPTHTDQFGVYPVRGPW
ncbi:MAG: hypothetical protein RLZZ396_734 [Planctomycetota bacterium]|jgi:hypothetical protein